MSLGKLSYHLLQLLHHATIAKDQSNVNLPLAFQKKVGPAFHISEIDTTYANDTKQITGG